MDETLEQQTRWLKEVLGSGYIPTMRKRKLLEERLQKILDDLKLLDEFVNSG